MPTCPALPHARWNRRQSICVAMKSLLLQTILIVLPAFMGLHGILCTDLQREGDGRPISVPNADEALTFFRRRLLDAQTQPLSHRVTLQTPFWLFHLPKTGGTTLRHMLHTQVFANYSTLYPCNNCGCVCPMTNPGNMARSTCAHAFLGHFQPWTEGPPNVILADLSDKRHCSRWSAPIRSSPGGETSDIQNIATRSVHDAMTVARHLGLNSEESAMAAVLPLLQHSICATVLRDPVDRMVSHFYEFIFRQKLNSSVSLPQYVEQVGIERVVTETGGNVMVHILGKGNMDMAIAVLHSCVVGTQESYAEFLQVMARILPMNVTSKSAAEAPRLQSNKRKGMEDSYVGGLRHGASPYLKADFDLWTYATRLAKLQFGIAMQLPMLVAA
eukprot:365123-Chlamydomonas_euryale.AAC.47